MKEYDLQVYLDTYVRGGTLPGKRHLVGIRKHAINSVKKGTWTRNMNVNYDCPLALLVMDDSNPHILYKLGKKDMSVFFGLYISSKVDFNSDKECCRRML